jgi:inositol 1,4,5-triphosphate receptor type 1
MCILTTLNQGLRNGGGIGDVLRQPSSEEPLYLLRYGDEQNFWVVTFLAFSGSCS